MKQLECMKTMSASKPWVPEQEAEAGAEIKSGDLYLLTPADLNSTSKSSSGRKRPSRCPVHVKIYRSCFGHYAVITASLRTPATYLNLRTCNCRPCGIRSPSSSSSFSSSFSSLFSSSSSSATPGHSSRFTTFRVELGGGEGQVIYFEVSPKDQGGVEEWVSAFQGIMLPSPGTISPSLSPVIPRTPLMPMVQESVEEEEEEEEVEAISRLG